MLSQAGRKNRPASCGRPCVLGMLTAQRRYLSATLLVYCWITTPETVFPAITKATCEQTFGSYGGIATLRCAYEPFKETIDEILWKKGEDNRTVYVYVPADQSRTRPVGEFTGRNVTTKSVVGGSRMYDMHIYGSRWTDEDSYQCVLIPSTVVRRIVPCPRLILAISPSMSSLSYDNGSSFISVPERDTDCTTGGITISTTGTTALRYSIASRPRSSVTWNQVPDGNSEHIPLSDNTTHTTFKGNVTVIQDDTKLVKFTITSQNPNFTAGPLVKEACIKLHHPGGSTPPGHKPGELAAIIVGSLAAVALISGGVALAMWKMRLACWKNTGEEKITKKQETNTSKDSQEMVSAN